MALVKTARISFSKKMVTTPEELAGIDIAIAALQKSLAEYLSLDNDHKTLYDPINNAITSYHQEYQYYTGVRRQDIAESDLIDSANFTGGNVFYPQNPVNPPPSLAPMVWTKTKPYSRNYGGGKLFTESFPSATYSPVISDRITTVRDNFNTFKGNYGNIQRATGMKCQVIPPVFPATVPTYGPPIVDPTLRSDASTVYSQIDPSSSDLFAQINAIKSIVQSNPDKDVTRKSANTALVSAINSFESTISSWNSLPDYSTHIFSSCPDFTGYDPYLLPASKFRDDQITVVTNALVNLRDAVFSARQSYLDTIFGSLSQDLNTGITTGSGIYFNRWQYLELRMNMVGGSLINYYTTQRAIQIQEENKYNIAAAAKIYGQLLFTSKLAAPSNGTKYLQVKDASGFAVGNTVWVCSDTQDEFSCSIVAINGNTLQMGQPIAAKYRDFENGRVYKEL